MRQLLFCIAGIFFTISLFGQFADTTELNAYIRDTIRDRRPEKVTAAQLQKALLGTANFLTPDPGNVSGTGTANRLPYWTGGSTIDSLPAGTVGQVLTSNGPGGTPTWQYTGIGGGTDGQMPFMNSGGTGFSYDSDVRFEQTPDVFRAGQGLTINNTTGTYPTHVTMLGLNHSINKTSTGTITWTTILGEVNQVNTSNVAGISNSSILGGNSNIMSNSNSTNTLGTAIFNSMILGGASSTMTASGGFGMNSSLIFGRFNAITPTALLESTTIIGFRSTASNAYAMAFGYKANATGLGSIAFGGNTNMAAGNNSAFPSILSAGIHSFNASTNSASQTSGHGALADYSAILGGLDANIPSTSPGSVILGGAAIKARASEADQVYVPTLNINTVPINDDTISQVLVRDYTTGKVKYRKASTFGGGGGGWPLSGRGKTTGNVLIYPNTHNDGLYLIGANSFAPDTLASQVHIITQSASRIASFGNVLTYSEGTTLIQAEDDMILTSRDSILIQADNQETGAENVYDVTIQAKNPFDYSHSFIKMSGDSTDEFTGLTKSFIDMKVYNQDSSYSQISLNARGENPNTVKMLSSQGPYISQILVDPGSNMVMATFDTTTLNTGAKFIGTSNSVSMSVTTDPANETYFRVYPHMMEVDSDDSGFSGINYTSDISANYTDRTLVDKGYVDNLMREAVVTIPSASVLTGFSSPVEILPAPGPGKYIAVINIFLSIDYAGTAYTGNTGCNFRMGSTNLGPNLGGGFLSSTVDTAFRFQPLSQQTELDQALVFFIVSGNSSSGNSDVKVRVLYKVLDI